MVAAVSKLMRNQDLISVASKCEVITRFRNTLGLKGRLSVCLQHCSYYCHIFKKPVYQ
ncbi:ethanolamine ammonia-lyase subunit EutB [Longitalea luteola]|uniref:ethanolamine ammonia-lyase subunit EutB n=1 Tax=Longitalea luteola TaxID=2812563 RepID=UPI001F6156D4|nr:ethanolamine ammonia-lyase subunit EutB [Longitalea luteola]